MIFNFEDIQWEDTHDGLCGKVASFMGCDLFAYPPDRDGFYKSRWTIWAPDRTTKQLFKSLKKPYYKVYHDYDIEYGKRCAFDFIMEALDPYFRIT